MKLQGSFIVVARYNMRIFKSCSKGKVENYWSKKMLEPLLTLCGGILLHPSCLYVVVWKV